MSYRYPLKHSKLVSFFQGGVLLMFHIIFVACSQISSTPQLFQKMSSLETGIDFRNDIIEDETYNILNFSNIYTGSGVGIGDFNNDGLPDIFFGGCMESSRLYLNQGNFKFKDVTLNARVDTDRWITGVSVVDINADGWQDIYLSVSGIGSQEKLKNLLFLNNGLKESQSRNQISFTEQAEAYGIAEIAQCTHANFFDYDKDGDLDLFLIVNPTDYDLNTVNTIRPKKVNGGGAGTDKLYRNNTIENERSMEIELSQKPTLPRFSDVSKEAGILFEGYSLGTSVSDLNNDNWPDIYVANDFLSNDVIYINNQDGTFTNEALKIVKHTSFSGMGMDVADINNDGKPELYVLDMLPEDNYRMKTQAFGKSYDRFQLGIDMGYQAQYTRNTLQFNNGDGTFSEVGQQFNVHKTDWGWSALLADYDNDGFRDLHVTNGFKRDLGNMDYVNYGNSNPFGTAEAKKERQLALIDKQPGAKLPNYIFKNDGGKNFIKKSEEWGIAEPSFSNGAAYADLDLDGDLDLIINNVGQEAFIFKNQADSLTQNHYIKVKLIGTAKNRIALGAKVWLYYGKEMQFIEHTTYRGYESSVDPILHFGLGKISQIDSIKVVFPNGNVAKLRNIATDTVLVVKNSASLNKSELPKEVKEVKWFQEIGKQYQLSHNYLEDLQVDFKNQPLLPHQHSQLGPAMANGDINNDGIEDIFIGGAAGKHGTLFVQNKERSFTPKEFSMDTFNEDTNAQLFDADNDGDLDLYICSGGVIGSDDSDSYQDRLYYNDGQGNFSKKTSALPKILSSTKALAIADYDQDGDLDIFVGGRVVPGKYPMTPTSYLLENQNGTFKDVTMEKAPALHQIGMISDALWTDYDNDKDLDLMLVGEWMPITIFKNEKGKLNSSPQTIPYSNGWWNTLAEGDFDQDGDMDYLVGNLGFNSNYKANKKEPLCIYAKDYDKNGSIDPVLCQYIDGVEHAVPMRNKLIEQIPPLKVRFNTYEKYAKAPFDEIFKRKELKGAQVLKSYILSSSYIENLGNERFEMNQLPMNLQVAPIKKFLVQDIDQDGFLDALVIGNDYSTDVTIGRYDAFTGAVMFGDGTGDFKVKKGASSGFLADKNAQNMIKVKLGALKEELFLVGNSGDSLQVFKRL